MASVHTHCKDRPMRLRISNISLCVTKSWAVRNKMLHSIRSHIGIWKYGDIK